LLKDVVIFDYGYGNIRSVQRAFEHIGANVSISSDYDDAINSKCLVVPGVGAFKACMEGLTKFRGDEVILTRAQRGLPVFGICVGHQVLFRSSDELPSKEPSNEGTERSNQVCVASTSPKHFDDGNTSEVTPGLGLYSADVTQLHAKIVPHMGWNSVKATTKLPSVTSGRPIHSAALSERSVFEPQARGVMRAQAKPCDRTKLACASSVSRVIDGDYYFVHSYAPHQNDISVLDADLVCETTHENDTFISAISRDCLFSTQFHPEKSGEQGLTLIDTWLKSL
jgi:glutamine amidotransferase